MLGGKILTCPYPLKVQALIMLRGKIFTCPYPLKVQALIMLGGELFTGPGIGYVKHRNVFYNWIQAAGISIIFYLVKVTHGKRSWLYF